LRAAGAAAPILDVGCGPGATVHYLRERGLECAGVDLSRYDPVAPALASVLRYGVDVLALPTAERERVRTVLLLDVLEHLREPSAFLRRCVGALPRLGHFVITVPARQELWSNYDAYYGHLRRYDRASAAAICRDAGVDVLRCGYFFHALYPALALQRLCGIHRSVEFSPVRHDWWHRLVAALLYRDAVWMPGALPGSSLLLVGRARV
jgi:SAM-dependent methyltransferase